MLGRPLREDFKLLRRMVAAEVFSNTIDGRREAWDVRQAVGRRVDGARRHVWNLLSKGRRGMMEEWLQTKGIMTC